MKFNKMGHIAVGLALLTGCAVSASESDTESTEDAVTTRSFVRSMEACEELADDEDTASTAAGIAKIGACYQRINDRAIPTVRQKLVARAPDEPTLQQVFANQREKAAALGDLLAARQGPPAAVAILKPAFKGQMETFLSQTIRDYGLQTRPALGTMGLQTAMATMNSTLRICSEEIDAVAAGPDLANVSAFHACLRSSVRAKLTELHAPANLVDALGAYQTAVEQTCGKLARYPGAGDEAAKAGKIQCMLGVDAQTSLIVVGSLQQD